MQDEQVLPRYEELLEGSKVAFVRDKVTKIDLEQRQIELASGLSFISDLHISGERGIRTSRNCY